MKLFSAFKKKTRTIAIYGDLDQKNILKIKEELDSILNDNVKVIADCFAVDNLNIVEEVKNLKLNYSLESNKKGHSVLKFDFKKHDLENVINIAKKFDITLGIECAELSIRGVLNDNDGSIFTVPKVF